MSPGIVISRPAVTEVVEWVAHQSSMRMRGRLSRGSRKNLPDVTSNGTSQSTMQRRDGLFGIHPGNANSPFNIPFSVASFSQENEPLTLLMSAF